MKFLSLDAFRGLSAIFVVLYHSAFYTTSDVNAFRLNSFLFVDFFFMLSGFVMAYSYVNRIQNGYNFKKYLIKRLARLYPLHIFTLFLWVPYILIKIYFYNIGVGASDPSVSNNIETFIYNLFLIQAWGVTESARSWNGPSWSISVELFAYLFFYFIISIVNQIKNKKYFQKLILYIFILLSIIFYLLYFNLFEEVERFSSLIRCLGGFLLGCILYYFWSFKLIKIQSYWIASLIETVSLISLYFIISNAHLGFMFTIETYFLFALIIYLFSIQNIGMISNLLKSKYFQKIGLLSYSIYMTHFIIVTALYNLFAYILKLDTFQFIFNGRDHTGIVFSFSAYLNFFIICLVILVSYFTYKYVEMYGKNKINQIFKND